MSQYNKTHKENGSDALINPTSLSPTAMPFLPKSLSNSTFVKTRLAVPGTTQHLEEIIEANEGIDDFGCFTTNSSQSRNIMIVIGDSYDAYYHIENLLKKIRPYYKGTHHVINIYPNAWLRCSNIRDAIKTYDTICKECQGVSTQYVSLSEWTKVASPDVKISRSEHEGQVAVRLNYPLSIDSKQIERAVRILLEEDGNKLYAYQKIPATAAGTLHLIAEFEDSLIAQEVTRRLDRRIVAGNAIVNICLHEPDLAQVQMPDQICLTSTRNQGFITPSNVEDMMCNLSMARPYAKYDASFASNFTSPISHLPVNSGYMFTPDSLPLMSPSSISSDNNAHGLSNSFVGMNNLSNTMTPLRPRTSSDSNVSTSDPMTPFTPQSNESFSMGRCRLGYSINSNNTGPRRAGLKSLNHMPTKNRQSNSSHNVVDINRIREGVDVRTTIMLRNIPNKIDQATLKSILDETSHGKYDFAYLRIDFSNDCNVGYAFVNFIDALHIIEVYHFSPNVFANNTKFVNARANQKWYRFRSQKVAEVSYATIQGRDCLIQKFRNSCVMLELPIFRPKLFYTFEDSLGRAGQEEPFPASDNPSKLRRSCENAEHVGLFAPNAGAQMRDVQRRRRSQYDRGTSLAQQDAFEVYLTDPWKLDFLENRFDYHSY